VTGRPADRLTVWPERSHRRPLVWAFTHTHRPGGRQGPVISTVDPQARHGHKASARGFDGDKRHVAIDPDAEIITATTVTGGNIGDEHSGHPMTVAVRLPSPGFIAGRSPGNCRYRNPLTVCRLSVSEVDCTDCQKSTALTPARRSRYGL